MTKREVICSQQLHLIKEIEDLRNDEFIEFLNKRINMKNELQEIFNRKYGVLDEHKKA